MVVAFHSNAYFDPVEDDVYLSTSFPVSKLGETATGIAKKELPL
jgi:hypothetical protein